MFSSPWHPVISLPGLLKQKSRPQQSRALYRRENVHWTMLSRFATPKKHGEQCPVNVQHKCPVVLPGLKRARNSPYEHKMETVSQPGKRAGSPPYEQALNPLTRIRDHSIWDQYRDDIVSGE